MSNTDELTKLRQTLKEQYNAFMETLDKIMKLKDHQNKKLSESTTSAPYNIKPTRPMPYSLKDELYKKLNTKPLHILKRQNAVSGVVNKTTTDDAKQTKSQEDEQKQDDTDEDEDTEEENDGADDGSEDGGEESGSEDE